MTTPPIEVVPLVPGSAEEYARFFDGAFEDNPDWAGCYCYFHLFAGSPPEWERASGEENRAAAQEAVRAGRQQGYLARREGHTAGWCQAMPASDLPGFYRWWPGLEQPEEAEATGVITCFVVAPSARGQGIARQLLDAACEGFRARGLRWAEAYPRKDADGAVRSYHGPLSMYLESGFTAAGETDRLVIVRREL